MHMMMIQFLLEIVKLVGNLDQSNEQTCSAISGLLDKDDYLRAGHELLNTE